MRSLLTKLLLTTVPTLAVVLILFYSALNDARQIHEDLLKMAEEDREAQLSSSLLVELRSAESWTARVVASKRDDLVDDLLLTELAQHLSEAEELLKQLAFGPEGGDPSDEKHQGRESRLYRSMQREISAFADASTADQEWSETVRSLGELRRKAEVLEAEFRAEALRLAADLDQRAGRLVGLQLLVGLAMLVTLAALAWFFRRVVLHPLQCLRDATQSLGRDRVLEHVEPRSRDEIGQLCESFNHMASSLHAQQEDLEERVRERTRELVRTARLADLGTIAAGIAHEINNPLASIATGVEGLGRQLRAAGASDESTLEYLEILGREAYRAKDITERLLRFGRQDCEKTQAVWLEPEANDVVSMLRSEANGKNLQLRLEFPADLVPVQGDPGECRQIFFNLLRNAIHAAPPGSTIHVEARSEDSGVSVCVRDEGRGLDESSLDRVFEPFYTTKPPGRGTGLGLAIVERILSSRQGRVWARNYGRGAEFGFWLPAAD